MIDEDEEDMKIDIDFEDDDRFRRFKLMNMKTLDI